MKRARLVPVLLAAALGLPLGGCDSASDDPACATLPPGAEASPLPSPTPCNDTGMLGTAH